MRGGCSFQQKVVAAQRAGAAAVIVVNHVMGGAPLNMAPDVPHSDAVAADGGVWKGGEETDSDAVTPDSGESQGGEETDSETVTPDGQMMAAGDRVSPGKCNPSSAAVSEEGSEAAEGSAAGEGSALGEEPPSAAETPAVGDSDLAVRIPSVSLGNADGSLLLAVLRGQMSVREAARRKAEGAAGESEGVNEGEGEGESELGNEGEREGEEKEGENEGGCEGEGEEEASSKNEKEQRKDQTDRKQYKKGPRKHGSGDKGEGEGHGVGRLDGGRGAEVWVKLFCPKKGAEEGQPELFDVDVSVPPQSPLQVSESTPSVILCIQWREEDQPVLFNVDRVPPQSPLNTPKPNQTVIVVLPCGLSLTIANLDVAAPELRVNQLLVTQPAFCFALPFPPLHSSLPVLGVMCLLLPANLPAAGEEVRWCVVEGSSSSLCKNLLLQSHSSGDDNTCDSDQSHPPCWKWCVSAINRFSIASLDVSNIFS
ncbi:unnamed protein product [Closterium sp. NIES-54]